MSELTTNGSRHLAPTAHVQLGLPLQSQGNQKPERLDPKICAAHHRRAQQRERSRPEISTNVASEVMSGEIWGCGTTGASSCISGSGLSSRLEVTWPLQSSRTYSFSALTSFTDSTGSMEAGLPEGAARFLRLHSDALNQSQAFAASNAASHCKTIRSTETTLTKYIETSVKTKELTDRKLEKKHPDDKGR